MRDSFRTRGYKQGWIHTCYDRSISGEVVSITLPDCSSRDVKSLHATKIVITRFLAARR